jgi:DNA-binding transcriptional LysR family regulator
MTLDDVRVFAKVAEVQSFTAAARLLGMPKQTVSRRVAELEAALGVQLLRRTTRSLHLTELGERYAERCSELVRLADLANRELTDAAGEPRGRLRITADPLFGETFLTDILVEYAKRWPAVELDVLLTQRRVDLVEEGYDVAVRIGTIDDSALQSRRLGPACVRYCASPAYLERRGTPAKPDDLTGHDCVVISVEGAPMRWPFQTKKGVSLVSPKGRLKVNSFRVAQAAALGGLGISIFPAFACEADIRAGKLVPVLDDHLVDAGSVWLVHPSHRQLALRVRAFLDLASARLRESPAWVVEWMREAPGVRKAAATQPPRVAAGSR